MSNGISSSITLADREYFNLTKEHQPIKELYDSIVDYLDKPETKRNQKVHRETLLQNVFDLLPKYTDIK